MPSIAICNEKGGPGKTTSAIHLVYWLAAKRKHKVAVIDADALRICSKWLTAMHFTGKMVQTTDPNEITDKIPELLQSAEFVIVDNAGNSFEQTRSALLRVDLALIPIVPAGIDLDACGEVVKAVQRIQSIRGAAPTGALFINRAKHRTRLLKEAREVLAHATDQLPGIKAMETIIFDREIIKDVYTQEGTVWDLKHKSAQGAASDYERLFKEVLKLI